MYNYDDKRIEYIKNDTLINFMFVSIFLALIDLN